MNITILNTAIKQDKKGLFCINDIHKASGNDKSKQRAKLSQFQKMTMNGIP